ncbi:MAG: SCO family protein [Actinomycetota bacterium]|nr:SCO family protein [Actinomycetota bacterium]
MKKVAIVAALLALGFGPVIALLALRHAPDHRSAASGALGPPPGPYRGSEPPGPIEVPAFALRSYRGPLVRMRALRGRVVLVTFIDTHCTTKCPIIAGSLGDGVRLLSRRERSHVSALALSVDPRHDTPASIRTFLRQRRALGELDFLKGPLSQMRPLWRAFHIVAAAQTGSADIHSADVRVFDPSGIWVSTLHVGVDLTAKNLAHDVRVALRSSGSEAGALSLPATATRGE